MPNFVQIGPSFAEILLNGRRRHLEFEKLRYFID